MDYNHRNFDAGNYDLTSFRGPVPGTCAPDFALTDSDGRSTRILEFEGEFLVLRVRLPVDTVDQYACGVGSMSRLIRSVETLKA